MRASTIPLLATLWLGALGAGCGAARPTRTTRPFSARLSRIFDDSVDYVESVEGLGGQLATDWGAQIDSLSRDSDVIAAARVETVLVETDAEGGRSYRLLVALTQPVRGDLPPEGRASLRVSEGQVGYRTVAGREQRLQSSNYLAFLRWYTDAVGDVRAHWHLSPLNDGVLARVRTQSGYIDRVEGVERITRQDPSQ